MSANHSSNVDNAVEAWGADMPAWIRLLASACDATNQRAVADRLGKSGGYVSRIVNQRYAGSYSEAEALVRATFGAEDVICPVWGEAIPLASCLRNRRPRGPATNTAQHAYARACPTCPNNPDTEED